MVDWAALKHFQKYEFDCSYTGENNMNVAFMSMQEQLRNLFRKPLVVSSGFRHFTHPVERAKENPGEHTFGVAADYNLWGVDALEFIALAYHCGIRRIGMNQVGALQSRFVHIGMGDQLLNLNLPAGSWTYKG